MALTPLAVSVLALLRERPMHPYEMYTVLMHRQADVLVKVRPGSLYHTVERLVRDGLAEATGTERDGARPERTTYALTPGGETAMQDWVRDVLTEPRREYPFFPVALAEAHNLSSEEVVTLLTHHLQSLNAEINLMESGIEQVKADQLAEAHWLEVDYLATVRRAERDWIATAINRLQTEDMPWPN